MTRTLLAIQFIGLASLTQACFGVDYKETLKNTPSSTVGSLLGEWKSANAASFPTSQSCGDLKWNVTSQDATQIAGNFEATCAGGIKLTGTASAVVNVNLIIEALGTATGFGSTACNFKLNGVGVLQPDSSIKVDYTGETCIGKISGTEYIKR